MRPLVFFTLPALYIVFSVASILAGTWGFVLICFGQARQAGYIMQAMDRLLAAMLGWDGRATVSKECGRCEKCWLCPWICRVLHYTLEKDHCQKEAK